MARIERVRPSNRALRAYPPSLHAERAAIQAELDALAAEQPEAVKTGFVEPLLRGVASHHAGCLPAWKGLVERLFQRGEHPGVSALYHHWRAARAHAVQWCFSCWLLPMPLAGGSGSALTRRRAHRGGRHLAQALASSQRVGNGGGPASDSARRSACHLPWRCPRRPRAAGLLKLVFATETLAAGINMPARTTLVAALSRR